MLMETCRPAHDLHSRNDVWLYVDELTHRTTNDYTAMLAVVEHASDFVADPMGQRALARVPERLRGAAIAHRALRDPKTDAPKRLDAELELLCEALCASLLEGRPISLTLNCDPINLNGQRCWRLCLILSELVRNAVRHAFVAQGAGRIIIEVRQEAGGLRCAVMAPTRKGNPRAPVPGERGDPCRHAEKYSGAHPVP